MSYLETPRVTDLPLCAVPLRLPTASPTPTPPVSSINTSMVPKTLSGTPPVLAQSLSYTSPETPTELLLPPRLNLDMAVVMDTPPAAASSLPGGTATANVSRMTLSFKRLSSSVVHVSDGDALTSMSQGLRRSSINRSYP